MINILALSVALLTLQPIRVIDLSGLYSQIIQSDDTLYVVNFWATWCKPCVEEMPYFFAAADKFSNQKVKVIFVSLNSVKEKNTVQKFVNDRNIQQEVLLLNAGNPNVWINEIDSSWSGAIPATMFYKNGKKELFYEGEFTPQQLDSIIQSKIN
ncbi:MAG: TlpA family protein disulfide reductase [Chitinophagales bacterium]|nr:TlpA family protein disulfide reductase [Chitinophagales bacterium]